MPLSGSRNLQLGLDERVWVVTSGCVELFLIWDTPADRGRRNHFATLQQGAWIFDLGFGFRDQGISLLAVGQPDTIVQEILPGYAQDNPKTLAQRLEEWTGSIQLGIAELLDTNPRRTAFFESGSLPALPQGATVGLRDGFIWWQPGNEQANYFGCKEVDVEFVPLVPASWVVFTAASGRTESISTMEFVQRPDWMDDLSRAHDLLLRTIQAAVQKREERNLHMRFHRDAIRRDAGATAWEQIGAVLTEGSGFELPELGSSDRASLEVAFARVAKRLGITMGTPPAGKPETEKVDIETAVSDLARASSIRFRRVLLADHWWRQDNGPLIAFIGEAEDPVALLFNGSRYVVHEADGTRSILRKPEEIGLHPFAFSLYRSLPDRKLRFADIRRFITFGNLPDFIRIGIMVILTGLLGLATPALTGRIFDVIVPQAERGVMLHIAVAITAAAVVRVLLELVRGIALIRAQNRTDSHLQAAVWDRILKLPTRFFRRFTAGDLANRAQGISEIHSILSTAGSTMLFALPTGLFNFIVMFRHDAKLSWWGLGIAVVAVATSAAFGIRQTFILRKQFEVQGKLAGLVFQILSGVAKFRIAAAEHLAFAAWAKEYTKQERLSLSAGRWSVATNTFLAGFTVIASGIIFALVAELMQKPPTAGSNGFTTGGFLAFNAAFGALVSSLIMAAQGSLQLLHIIPLLERTKPIFEAEPETTEVRENPGPLRGGIELANVGFSYADDLPQVLSNLSFKVDPGEFVAIVGPSGSGKSTILRLLLGFEKPNTGMVLFDGQDIQTLNVREVRRQIGVVMQDSSLIAGDIFRNIVGEANLTQNDAWRAAEMAGIADDIRAMPMQMNTVVSEGGGGFSGGQKQRLAIARALARAPKLLFFDEATSALDNRTQSIVTDSLDSLQVTRIVIAHRLSTVAKAGRIMVMSGGRLMEQGTYPELMQARGLFYELAQRQLAESM